MTLFYVILTTLVLCKLFRVGPFARGGPLDWSKKVPLHCGLCSRTIAHGHRANGDVVINGKVVTDEERESL